MPRSARIDIPDLLQHVIVRGIEKRDIFLDDDDRLDFVTRLSALQESTGSKCLAWALIPNHFHLLLRTADVSLSRFMRRLLTGYAVTFNLRHHRSGHLFQNRYKSIVCDEDAYLLELIRWVLGGGDFVEQVLRQTGERRDSSPRALDQIIQAILDHLKIPLIEILSRKRTAPLADARGIICHVACLSGHRGVDIARRLNVSGACVTVAARRARELFDNDPTLQEIVSKFGKLII